MLKVIIWVNFEPVQERELQKQMPSSIEERKVLTVLLFIIESTDQAQTFHAEIKWILIFRTLYQSSTSVQWITLVHLTPTCRTGWIFSNEKTSLKEIKRQAQLILI